MITYIGKLELQVHMNEQDIIINNHVNSGQSIFRNHSVLFDRKHGLVAVKN